MNRKVFKGVEGGCPEEIHPLDLFLFYIDWIGGGGGGALLHCFLSPPSVWDCLRLFLTHYEQYWKQFLLFSICPVALLQLDNSNVWRRSSPYSVSLVCFPSRWVCVISGKKKILISD